MQLVHNFSVIIVILFSYACLIIHLVTKTSNYHTVGMTDTQRRIIIQCSLICLANFISALIYVGFSF